MRRSLVTTLVLVVLVMIGLALYAARQHLDDHSVLVVELDGELEEAPPLDLVSQFTARGPSLPTLLLLLDMAAADERIDGVLVHVKSLSIGYGRLQELRDALAAVKAANKKVVVL